MEVGRRKTEVGRRKLEVGSWKTEDGSNSSFGNVNCFSGSYLVAILKKTLVAVS